MIVSPAVKKSVFFILILLCLTPYVNAQTALLLGIIVALVIGNPYEKQSSNAVKWLLKFAVIGLGFGMDFFSAVNAGKDGLLLTVGVIITVLLAGWIIGRVMQLNKTISYLVSSGTAICGGSAIAAVSPIVKASGKEISVALGVVFLLNALALLIFPSLGHLFSLSQYQFGLWSAIAIHDTSSVIGASAAYGPEALQTATTVKLGRALWIIPLSLITLLFYKGGGKIKPPYFIGLFVIAMLVNTYLPQFNEVYDGIVIIARKALVITLFLIGTALSPATIKQAGIKTLAHGVLLWLLISGLSLAVILTFY